MVKMKIQTFYFNCRFAFMMILLLEIHAIIWYGDPKSETTICIHLLHQIQLYQVILYLMYKDDVFWILYTHLGEQFKVYILLGDHRFHIAINDESYCTYIFRLSIDLIKTIEVTKDLQSIVQIDHRSMYPIPFPAIQVDDNKIEFSNDIPRKFAPGIFNIYTVARCWEHWKFRGIGLFENSIFYYT